MSLEIEDTFRGAPEYDQVKNLVTEKNNFKPGLETLTDNSEAWIFFGPA